MGAEHSGVVGGGRPRSRRVGGLAASGEARESFSEGPPTTTEFEAAVAAVEEAMLLAPPLVDGRSLLHPAVALIREIALASRRRAQPDLVLPPAARDRTFSRLAAVAQGSPAVVRDVADSGDPAATLLILREFRHRAGPVHHRYGGTQAVIRAIRSEWRAWWGAVGSIRRSGASAETRRAWRPEGPPGE